MPILFREFLISKLIWALALKTCYPKPESLAIECTDSRNALRINTNDLVDAQLNNPITSRVIKLLDKGKKRVPKYLYTNLLMSNDCCLIAPNLCLTMVF